MQLTMYGDVRSVNGGGVGGDTGHRAAEVVQVELGLHREVGGAAMEVGERWRRRRREGCR